MPIVSSHEHNAVPDVPADKAADFMSKYRSIVRKAWTDPEFLEQYRANPEQVLRDNGIDIPEGVKVKVVEHGPDEIEGETVITMPLPHRSTTSLDDEQLLAAVSGGGSTSCASSSGSASCPCCSASSSGCAC
jgi:hypothetical protein